MKLLRKKQRAYADKLSSRELRFISVMQVLSDPTRYKIFKIMLSRQEKCVSEVASEVNISVPAASQHFRIFELVGLVDKKRTGQKVCYTLNQDDEIINDLVTII